ncbi:uncharacterized protein LOC127128164 isoform X2 [Lathyrus oleraceus]|uniref:uncharacterized protein LOC127128164 isoform X2 n=1 Tax=Pisum sativum TaxID=3888 RepID=UPI0021D167CD|nr:uncharacterized protein LOC127128164 isoform X2 [Pisum sativum]
MENDVSSPTPATKQSCVLCRSKVTLSNNFLLGSNILSLIRDRSSLAFGLVGWLLGSVLAGCSVCCPECLMFACLLAGFGVAALFAVICSWLVRLVHSCYVKAVFSSITIKMFPIH